MCGESDIEPVIAISALQHYLFCPRQCALIHVDGLWAENRFTAEGGLLHRRVDQPGSRRRPKRSRQVDDPCARRIARALPLLSRRYGLTGKADCVEFPVGSAGKIVGPPRPVEHKRGKPKRHDADRVQLCAQALCLEEMLGVEIGEGDLFYNELRRRETIVLDAALRERTLATVRAVRELVVQNMTPPAVYGAKCRNCSLRNLCLPKVTGSGRSAAGYLDREISSVGAYPE